MSLPSASVIAKRWADRMGQSTTKMIEGVDAVTVYPGDKAIAAKDKMIANFQRAMNDGTWEEGLRKSNLADWKSKMKTVGIPRVAEGARAAQSKYERAMTSLLPHIAAGMAQIDSMPNVTIDDSIARAGAWIRHMSNYRRS